MVFSPISKTKSVSYLEYEIDLNDAKREISILQPQYVEIYLRDMANIMTYKPSNKIQSLCPKLKS